MDFVSTCGMISAGGLYHESGELLRQKLLTLTLEKLENEWHVISDHPMTKEHSIAFVTLLTGDTVVTRKLYPEWNMETRLPYFRHGILVWYCNQHGLFYQNF